MVRPRIVRSWIAERLKFGDLGEVVVFTSTASKKGGAETNELERLAIDIARDTIDALAKSRDRLAHPCRGHTAVGVRGEDEAIIATHGFEVLGRKVHGPLSSQARTCRSHQFVMNNYGPRQCSC